MYYPYFRGKQFELLALREMADTLAVSGKIIPIIEPVSKNLSGFERALDAFNEKKIRLIIVCNPTEGDFKLQPQLLLDFLRPRLIANTLIEIGILVHNRTNFELVEEFAASLHGHTTINMVHRAYLNDAEAFSNFCLQFPVQYHFSGPDVQVRRYRGIVKPESRIILEDKFIAQEQNKDYLNVPEEIFSDEHLYFHEDGYAGFGDYTTIGIGFSEGGGAPVAVAIHLTFKKPNGIIWIRHFVSDTNVGQTDVAGKFGEALIKLIDFANENQLESKALEKFREHYALQHYPGLGSIKKLSIMHHLELMTKILS